MVETSGRVAATGNDPGTGPIEPQTGALAVGEAVHLRPGDPGSAAYPVTESEYWRQAFAHEPYCEGGRPFEDYAAAYELGWTGCIHYGGEFDIAERVLANDWPVRKGLSALDWEQARPAVRAAWQRAEIARSYVSDGTADRELVLRTLNELRANARAGELALREASGQASTPGLVALLQRMAQGCAGWTARWCGEIARLGGVAGEGGGVAGAAHRAWLQIRGLFGGASDEALLAECERGLKALAQCGRAALGRNLPAQLHAAVQRQCEDAQRQHDHIRHLRDGSAAEVPVETGQPA